METVKDYQPLIVFGLFGAFWFLRFMFGHKLVWLRCKFGLHKFEDWDWQSTNSRGDQTIKDHVSQGIEETKVSVETHRSCLDCGERDAMYLTDVHHYQHKGLIRSMDRVRSRREGSPRK